MGRERFLVCFVTEWNQTQHYNSDVKDFVNSWLILSFVQKWSRFEIDVPKKVDQVVPTYELNFSILVSPKGGSKMGSFFTPVKCS